MIPPITIWTIPSRRRQDWCSDAMSAFCTHRHQGNLTDENTIRPPTHLRPDTQVWELHVLQDMFRKAKLGLQQERLIVIADALDECDQAGVRAMVEYLESSTEAAQAKKISLEACYASRHYPHIMAKSCESMIVEDRLEHAQDIHFYISNNLRVTHGALRDDLRLELVKKSQAVFL